MGKSLVSCFFETQCMYCTHASASVLVRERSLVLRSNFSRSQYGKKTTCFLSSGCPAFRTAARR